MTTTPSRAEALFARDQQVVWHPFTQHAQWPTDDPLVVTDAEGMYLIDGDGRRYLDGNSSLWVNVHGHRVPELDDAVRQQLDRMSHTTFLGVTHEPGIRLAETLVDVAPEGLTRAFFGSDGSSSVEAALKMAYQSSAQRGTPRPLYVHVAEGYHGDTLGAVSVGGIDLFHATYRPLLLSTLQIDSPGLLREGQSRAERANEVIDQLRALMAERADEVCAIVVEPMVQAAGGMLTHDAAFLRGVREIATSTGALLIVDEVATGIGRTGAMWACEHAGIAPDLLTLGKGVTGGYLPLSAVLAAEAVYDDVLGAPDEARTFFHGHSYTANPLACAVAIANFDLIEANGTIAHAAQVGTALGQLLQPLEGYAGVKEIRRIGTMTGIEVEAVPGLERTGFEVCRVMRDHGVLTRPLGDVVVLMPPLAIGTDDLTLLAATCIDAIHQVVQ